MADLGAILVPTWLISGHLGVHLGYLGASLGSLGNSGALLGPLVRLLGSSSADFGRLQTHIDEK